MKRRKTFPSHNESDLFIFTRPARVKKLFEAHTKYHMRLAKSTKEISHHQDTKKSRMRLKSKRVACIDENYIFFGSSPRKEKRFAFGFFICKIIMKDRYI